MGGLISRFVSTQNIFGGIGFFNKEDSENIFRSLGAARREAGMRAVLLLVALASGGECKRTGRGPASCQGRCACMTFRAHASLKRMQVMAETCATSAESGIVDRSELDDATKAASSAVESIREMRETCAAACVRGCRGCRVSRLLNQTKALQEGVDEVVEMGTFVDDE